MEKVFTVLPLLFLLVLITTFPLNYASASQPQDSCCGSAIESVVATSSGCICDDDIQIEMENLALINVTRMMMKLRTVCGVSLTCDVDAPELENLIANSAESPSSQSMSKAQPPYATAPASIEVQDDSTGATWGSYKPFCQAHAVLRDHRCIYQF